MTPKLRHDLAGEINTITMTCQLLRRLDMEGGGLNPGEVLNHLSKIERATTNLWATVYAESLKETT